AEVERVAVDRELVQVEADGSGHARGELAQDLEDALAVAQPRPLPERARDRRLELGAWRDQPRAGQGLARGARDGGAQCRVAAGEVVAEQAEVEGAEHEGEEPEGGDRKGGGEGRGG